MNRFILFFVCMLIIFVSCENDLDAPKSELMRMVQTKSGESQLGFHVVKYDGEGCVKFENDSVFKQITSDMTFMSDVEKKNLFSLHGFESQIDLMENAIKEQEEIVDIYEKDLSQPYPSTKIKLFKQKYEDIFLFNPYDSTDFIPNYKVSMYRHFTNKDGIFIIGDSIVSVSKYTEVDLFGEPVMTYGSNSHTNYSSVNKAETKYQIPNGDYVKARVLVEFVGPSYDYKRRDLLVFGFELLSQKKKVLWKRHHADLYLTFDLKGAMYDSTMPNQFIANGSKIAVYGQESADRHPIGAVAQNATAMYRYSVGGTLEVWTNEIPIKGYTTVDIFSGPNF